MFNSKVKYILIHIQTFILAGDKAVTIIIMIVTALVCSICMVIDSIIYYK